VEDPTSGTTHDLLLALAGRVDDDLLRWARELVALGEDARAVEMLTASLVAARAVLPPQVRSALVSAARTARTDLGPAAALPPPRPEDGTEHRFAPPVGNDPVAGAVLRFPARPLTGCRVLLARRLTPAGTAPGPLPHPVVLVRVHDHTRRADVLAYQLGAALERAGAPASVEVLPADGPVPAYHAAALDAAVQLRDDVADDRQWRPAPEVAPAPRPQPAPPVERHALAPPVGPPPRRRAPDPHPLAPEPPTPAPRYAAEVDRPPDPGHQVDDRSADDGAATARLRPAGERQEQPEAATRPPAEPAHRLGESRDDRHDEHEDDPDDGDGVEDRYDDSGRHDSDHDEDGDDADPPDDEHVALHDEDAFPEPPSPHPLAAPRPLPVRDEPRPARPTPLPSPPPPPPPTPLLPRDGRSRPTVTPISRPAANPIPLVRRGGPNPVPRPVPVTDPRPPLRRTDDEDELQPPVDERPEPPPARRDTPAFESLSDPLNGPLHQPLLAPLLDPTRPEDDPLGSADRPSADRRPDDGRADDRSAEPAAAQSDDDWSQEWLSGTWAMAPSALDEPADTRREREPVEHVEDVDPGRPAPRPVPRSPARHRFPDEQPPNGSSATPDRAEEAADEPSGQDREEREEIGLRPDSIARLSDADRQLLARLQAELLEGRRQRIGRRITNGVPTNGSHRGSPPDYTN
jgi:hypothetical protein